MGDLHHKQDFHPCRCFHLNYPWEDHQNLLIHFQVQSQSLTLSVSHSLGLSTSILGD